MSDKSKDFRYPFWINSPRSSSPSSSNKESCSDCKANKTLELILEKLELQNSLMKLHFFVSNENLRKEKNSEELKNKIIIQQMQEKIQSLTEKVNDQQIMLQQNLNFQQMQLKFNDHKKEKDNEINQNIKVLELKNKELENELKKFGSEINRLEEIINVNVQGEKQFEVTREQSRRTLGPTGGKSRSCTLNVLVFPSTSFALRVKEGT
uniref:Uncharacterized protein n=1 Tax=Meloidogyne hapla TaxID=6305 RepID=A0A1I8B779_MELHA